MSHPAQLGARLQYLEEFLTAIANSCPEIGLDNLYLCAYGLEMTEEPIGRSTYPINCVKSRYANTHILPKQL